MANAKQQPNDEIRTEQIKATIWENQTTAGIRHNVTGNKIYKDGEEWKQTDSFGRNELQFMTKVIDLAHTWIFPQAA
jgi:hypothetical protein